MDMPTAVVIRQHLIDPEICIRCNTCESVCPQKAITHDSNNYVVDAAKCNLCMDCVPPCPTGSIDNWRMVPRARAYSIESQLEWDALPEELGAEELGADGLAEADSLSSDGLHAEIGISPMSLAAEPATAAFNATSFNSPVPPWSAAHPYTNL